LSLKGTGRTEYFSPLGGGTWVNDDEFILSKRILTFGWGKGKRLTRVEKNFLLGGRKRNIERKKSFPEGK